MQRFNPLEGHYWVCETVDRRWAVMWSHADHPNWHYMVASFADRIRATDYALTENDLIDFDPVDHRNPVPVGEAPPAPPPHAPAPDRDPVSVSYPWREQVVRDLSKLFAEHPTGFGVSLIQQRYGMTYLAAADLLRWMHAEKLGIWTYENGNAGRKIFLPPDSQLRFDPLSKKQRRLLEAMEFYADAHGIVAQTHRELAFKAGLSPNGLGSMIYALEQRKFVMLASPAHDGNPAKYQILRRSGEAPAVEEAAE